MVHLLALAFPAGVAAFFNPCGFIVLVAYVTNYLKEKNFKEGSWKAMVEGAKAGILATIGFVLLFVSVGMAFTFLGRGLALFIPQFISLVGVGLILLGIGYWFGKIYLSVPTATPTEKRPSFVFYGIFYAIASLGCVLPIFLAVLSASLTESVQDAFLVFVTYAI